MSPAGLRFPSFARSARALLAPLLLLAPLAVALAACDHSAAEPKAAAERPVLAATVHYEPLVPLRTFVAVIEPRIESELGFRVSGKVVERLVQAGDRVAAGQPLARLDDTDLQLQLEQAEAEQRAAQRSLEQAEADERRGTELNRKGNQSDAALDRQKADAEEARSRLIRAQKAVEIARNNLSYATLVSDAPGVVTATLVEPGQVVDIGNTAIKVARLQEKEAVVAVPETLIERVRRGSAVVALWSDADRQYAAKLRELSPAADATTHTYLARFSLPDADEGVELGMTATLTLSEAGTEEVARLPLSALFDQGEGPAVWVVDPASGTLSLRPVTVRAYEAKVVLLAGGVAEGDQVVVLGAHKLDPQDKVRILQALAF